MRFSDFRATEFAFKTSDMMKKRHHGRPFCRLKRLIKQKTAPPMSLANPSEVVIEYTTQRETEEDTHVYVLHLQDAAIP